MFSRAKVRKNTNTFFQKIQQNTRKRFRKIFVNTDSQYGIQSLNLQRK